MSRSVEKSQDYQSYLLRLWRRADTGHWQISVHQVQTAEEWHFVAPEALFHFLLTRMEEDRPIHNAKGDIS